MERMMKQELNAIGCNRLPELGPVIDPDFDCYESHLDHESRLEGDWDVEVAEYAPNGNRIVTRVQTRRGHWLLWIDAGVDWNREEPRFQLVHFIDDERIFIAYDYYMEYSHAEINYRRRMNNAG